MDKIRLYTVSLGCPKNLVDTENIIGSLDELCIPVSSPYDADLIVINTCGFIEDSVKESVDTILELCEIKKINKSSAFPYIVVTGCLVSRYLHELEKEIPEVDLFLSISEQSSLKNIVRKVFKYNHKTSIERSERILSTPPSYGYLKIAEGCNHNCSFCTIPYIRGRLRSFDEERILSEGNYILSTGRKELILVAQDLTSYGLDMGKKRGLYELLKKVSLLDGLLWLRLLYLYPKGIDEDFLKFLKDISPPFVPYFDIPLQHSHPEILKKMGRPFKVTGDEIVSLIRKYFEDAAIRTSLIVGFPGEEEGHFKHLIDFVERIKFTHLGVFTYSREEGTKAALFPGEIPEEIKKERKEVIMEIQKNISRDFLKKFKGKKLQVIVDKKNPEWPTLYEGRAWFFAPEIDGVVYVSGENIRPADVVDVVIEDTYDYDLGGII